MRILLVSDLHYSLPQLDWVVRAAPRFDLVVVAGDLLRIGSTVPRDAQAVVVLEYLDRIHATTAVAVASGNHDLTGRDAQGEQSALWLSKARAAGIPTDGDSTLFGDTLVTICPWWDGPMGRADLDRQLSAAALRRPKRWIWVYHWPPLGSVTCWTGRRDYGDPDLGSWIAQHSPDLVLAGHVHQSPFKKDGSWVDLIGSTWVFNAGNQIGSVPTHIEIDLDLNQAVWSSLLGSEEIDLSRGRLPERTIF